MEKYCSEKKIRIVAISRSKDNVGVEEKTMPQDGVLFSLIPCLEIEENNKLISIVLESQFFDKNKKPISNKLVIRVKFQFEEDLPIANGNENSAVVNNYEDLVSIFDTSIGILRGILYEWLKGTSLQQPLPYMDIEELFNSFKLTFRT